MKINLNVDVHHLTRVEGHGNILVKVEDGEVREARWDVVETPRFFEAMLRGKHYTSAGILTARICGICSIGHCLASIRATENAFGVVIPETAAKLRLLAKHGETLQSHVLHLFFLAAPDFLGLPSVLPLVGKDPKAFDLARRLKSLAGHLFSAVASSSTPPVSARTAKAALKLDSLKRPATRAEIEKSLLNLATSIAPESLGLPSVIDLADLNPEVINIARRLKSLGNRICDTVAGRTTHPVSLQVGGVAAMPDKDKLLALRDELERSVDDLAATAELFSTLTIPNFVRETEFVSLKGEGDYPFIGGRLVSSDGVEKAESEYLAMTNEYVDDNNTSKWCKLSRQSFAVGALARFNNNYRFLQPEASKLASQLGFSPVCHNPFMNNVAQLIESVHVVYDMISLIDDLVKTGSDETMAPVTPKAGEGVGAVEVPRGILYHHYKYDKEGRIVQANCIIPTTQNNANIHYDMKALAKQFAVEGMTDSQLELLCSMLVRAYDPCISCSVH